MLAGGHYCGAENPKIVHGHCRLVHTEIEIDLHNINSARGTNNHSIQHQPKDQPQHQRQHQSGLRTNTLVSRVVQSRVLKSCTRKGPSKCVQLRSPESLHSERVLKSCTVKGPREIVQPRGPEIMYNQKALECYITPIIESSTNSKTNTETNRGRHFSEQVRAEQSRAERSGAAHSRALVNLAVPSRARIKKSILIVKQIETDISNARQKPKYVSKGRYIIKHRKKFQFDYSILDFAWYAVRK